MFRSWCASKLSPLVLATVVLACSPAPGNAPPAEAAGNPSASEQPPGELVFRSTVEKLFNHRNSLAEGKEREDVVEVTLPGRLFAPPIPLPDVTRDAVDRTTLEGALASDVAAFRADDAEWILENFAPSDQQKIAQQLEREDLRARNKAALDHIHSMEIWGMATYGEYGLVMYRYDGDSTRGLVPTFTKVGNEWKRTNVLSADEVFDVVLSAFRSGGEVIESE
ncbi:MAG: hypothetical protein HKM89_03735 [Gemmatimonadales bacterium]|nr:hypothetical protein [Gemmatimonadales bacterium]